MFKLSLTLPYTGVSAAVLEMEKVASAGDFELIPITT